MNTSPYTSPKADLELSGAPVGKEGAWVPDFLTNKSRHLIGQRWLATVVDFAVCLFLLFLTLNFINIILGEEKGEQLGLFWLIICPILYYSLMEGLTGCTVGKFLVRVRVVNEYGQVPGIPKAIIRTLFRLLEVNPFLFGAIPAGIVALCSKRSQRVGDMVANTYVIANKHLKEN